MAPESTGRLTERQHKLLPVKKSVAQVTQATSEIEKLATTNAEAKAVEVKRHPITETFVTRTPEFIASAVFFVILLYFLLCRLPSLHRQTGQVVTHALR